MRRSAGSVVVEGLEDRVLFSRVLGIDISSYQPTSINWTQVKTGNGSNAPGYTFAYAKATEGLGYNDSHFAGYVSGAHSKGVLIGAYHYARYDLGNDPVAEANHYLSIAFNGTNPKLGAGDMVPMLDVEAPWNSGDSSTYHSKTGVSNWVKAWCNRVQQVTGAVPIIYTGAYYADSWLDSTISQTYPLWVAAYPSGHVNPQTGAPSYLGNNLWQTWQMWQYTDGDHVNVNDGGYVYGLGGTNVVGSCDADVLNGDESVLKDYIIGSEGRWADGTWVKPTTTVKAWQSSTANGAYTSVAAGVVGKVLQGPVYGNGYQRWQVQFNNGVTGWVAEDLAVTVAPSVVTSPNPASSSTTYLNPPPATFTWGGGGNATSYVVYLDNIKKGTVTSKSWNHPALANGTHTWRVDAVNGELTTTGPTWTFVSGLPPAYMAGSTLYVNFASTGTAIINASGGNIVVSQGGTNYTFPAASVAAIDVAATAGDDALTIFGRIAAPISFDDGGGSDTITINPSASVTFAADVPGATVVLGSGAFLEAAVPLHLASLSIGGGTVYLDPGGSNTLAVGDLSITGGGNLDLSDNALVWDYAADAGTPADTLRTYLNRARNGGTWDGSGGIGSSEAYADPTHTAALGYLEASSLGVTSFAGVDVDGTALVVKYTVAGDVNLNGAVDGDDYALTDRAFARNAANPHWLNGDFDYDGVLGASDYLLLDTSALVQGGGTPSPALLATREATFGPAYVSALTAALTPEPETTTTAPADPATPPFSEAPIAADVATTEPAPVAVVTGPTKVRRHKPAHFKFAVADAPAGNWYTYSVDWNGDGVADQTVTGGASVNLGHRFAQAGHDGITLWVTDDVTGLMSDPTSLGFRVL